jgi:hypothetical protein
LLAGFEFALGVGKEVGPVAAQNVKNKHFRADARRFDFRGFELGDGCAERLTELHDLLYGERRSRTL